MEGAGQRQAGGRETLEIVVELEGIIINIYDMIFHRKTTGWASRRMGLAWVAALAVILLAALLIGYARSIKPAPEVEMIREMREVALNDLKDEVALADAELVALKDEVRSFLRNPVETIFPAAIGPLLVAVTRALKSRSK